MTTKRTRVFVLAGLVLALILAGVVSYYASSSPDGLNRVAANHKIDRTQQEHQLSEAPLAGYSTKGVDNDRLSGGLAGVAGVALTFLLGGGIALAVRRRGGGAGS